MPVPFFATLLFMGSLRKRTPLRSRLAPFRSNADALPGRPRHDAVPHQLRLQELDDLPHEGGHHLRRSSRVASRLYVSRTRDGKDYVGRTSD